MTGRRNFDCRSYYDLSRQRVIPIQSAAGQAQFFLNSAMGWITAPNERLLLCRFASTIDASCGERELQQLRRLARYLDQNRFEQKHGHIDPVVGREVEYEIVQRQAMDCAMGYNLTPAMRLLAEYERDGPVFSQPERNLLLRNAFCLGDQWRTTEIADQFREKRCSRHQLTAICRELEQTELGWAGLESMDGLQYRQTKAPGSGINLKNCEDPMKHYPPFGCYPPLALPENSVVLQNGVILLPDQKGWWYSSTQRADQTFAAPHFYKAAGNQTFTIADQEYEELFQYQDAQLPDGCLIVGRVTFANGEQEDFTDPQEYLQTIREELPYLATTGFCYETLTDDPAVRKAVDDMLFDLYGEENPRTLEDYGSIGMTMGESNL